MAGDSHCPLLFACFPHGPPFVFCVLSGGRGFLVLGSTRGSYESYLLDSDGTVECRILNSSSGLWLDSTNLLPRGSIGNR